MGSSKNAQPLPPERLSFRSCWWIVCIWLFAPVVFIGVVFCAVPGVIYLAGPARWTANTMTVPGYSDQEFGRIRGGMTKAEVLDIVGPPIKNPGPVLRYINESPFGLPGGWLYAIPKPMDGYGRAYRVRYITFDKTGHVSRIVCENHKGDFMEWLMD